VIIDQKILKKSILLVVIKLGFKSNREMSVEMIGKPMSTATIDFKGMGL
jgi:hypothetical protein